MEENFKVSSKSVDSRWKMEYTRELFMEKSNQS